MASQADEPRTHAWCSRSRPRSTSADRCNFGCARRRGTGDVVDCVQQLRARYSGSTGRGLALRARDPLARAGGAIPWPEARGAPRRPLHSNRIGFAAPQRADPILAGAYACARHNASLLVCFSTSPRSGSTRCCAPGRTWRLTVTTRSPRSKSTAQAGRRAVHPPSTSCSRQGRGLRLGLHHRRLSQSDGAKTRGLRLCPRVQSWSGVAGVRPSPISFRCSRFTSRRAVVSRKLPRRASTTGRRLWRCAGRSPADPAGCDVASLERAAARGQCY